MTDLDYLRHAYKVAAEFSHDPVTQNGAVLVDEAGRIVAAGANTFPRGVRVTEHRTAKPLKYSFMEHAERNAIFEAASEGIQARGLVMYCAWAACADCGRAIIQAGVKELVTHAAEFHQDRPDWNASIALAAEMFAEAGVVFRKVPGHVGGVKIRFNGQEVEP
jgi:dCMP deaminase